MFYVKRNEGISDYSHHREQCEVIKIATNGDFIPLQRNWAETWCSMPATFARDFKQIYEFEVRSDDVFVVTFPKSGTTWIQEAAWLIINGLDYQKASEEHLFDRSVYLEYTSFYDTFYKNTVQLAANLKSPRLIKSHLPAQLLPRQLWKNKTKVIYCARNAKDLVVSYSHFLRGMGAYNGTEQEFIDDFIQGNNTYTPFWPHVLHMWQMRQESHIFFTTYEEMQRDLRGVVTRLNTFLDKSPLDEEQLLKLLDHLSFNNMKNSSSINPTENIRKANIGMISDDFQFMRRGIVGSYKDELSVENQHRLDDWTEKCFKEYNISLADIFGTV